MYTNNNKESRSNSEYWTKKNELAKKAKLHTEKMKEKYCFLMMERIYVYFLACG